MTTERRPLTQRDYNRASESRAIERGARRIPGGLLPPEAAAALDRLQATGYGASAAQCIARALIEAAARATADR